MITHCKIQKLAEMPTKRSDHDNGYYIQDVHWGTCFHRRSTRRKDFNIYHNRLPRFLHTYTRIPEAAWHETYSVYVKYEVGESVYLDSPDGLVVGFDAPQPSADERYLNRSFLVYAPKQPAVSVGAGPENLEGFFMNNKYVTAASYFRCMKYFDMDLEGNRVFKSKGGTTIGDLFKF